MPGSYLQLGRESFVPCCFQFINRPIIRRYSVSATNSVVKLATHNNNNNNNAGRHNPGDGSNLRHRENLKYHRLLSLVA
jgi:hypothetical protein